MALTQAPELRLAHGRTSYPAASPFTLASPGLAYLPMQRLRPLTRCGQGWLRAAMLWSRALYEDHMQKKPATSTTRKGNGAGWGGAAKGEGKTDPGPGKPAGMKAGEGKAAMARARLEAAADAAAQTVVSIASDINDPRALQAAQHVLLRVLGDPAALQVTGAGGGPIEIVRRIVDPRA